MVYRKWNNEIIKEFDKYVQKDSSGKMTSLEVKAFDKKIIVKLPDGGSVGIMDFSKGKPSVKYAIVLKDTLGEEYIRSLHEDPFDAASDVQFFFPEYEKCVYRVLILREDDTVFPQDIFGIPHVGQKLNHYISVCRDDPEWKHWHFDDKDLEDAYYEEKGKTEKKFNIEKGLWLHA